MSQRTLRTTHTVVELELSAAAFAEIAGKLKAAGCHPAFLEDAPLIDMTGIAVKPLPQEVDAKRFTLFVVGGDEAYGQWRNNFVGGRQPSRRTPTCEDFGGFRLVRITNHVQALGLRKSDANDVVILPDADLEAVRVLRQRGFKPSSREVPRDAVRLKRMQCCARDHDHDGHCDRRR